MAQGAAHGMPCCAWAPQAHLRNLLQPTGACQDGKKGCGRNSALWVVQAAPPAHACLPAASSSRSAGSPPPDMALPPSPMPKNNPCSPNSARQVAHSAREAAHGRQRVLQQAPPPRRLLQRRKVGQRGHHAARAGLHGGGCGREGERPDGQAWGLAALLTGARRRRWRRRWRRASRLPLLHWRRPWTCQQWLACWREATPPSIMAQPAIASRMQPQARPRCTIAPAAVMAACCVWDARGLPFSRSRRMEAGTVQDSSSCFSHSCSLGQAATDSPLLLAVISKSWAARQRARPPLHDGEPAATRRVAPVVPALRRLGPGAQASACRGGAAGLGSPWRRRRRRAPGWRPLCAPRASCTNAMIDAPCP